MTFASHRSRSELDGGSAACIDRRRSARRWLREPTEVGIQLVDGPGPSVSAKLLNASVHGVACRVVDSEIVRNYVVGERVRIGFALGGKPPSFDLVGRIMNRMHVGAPDRWLIGMEFEWDSCRDGERERLRAAVETVRDGGGESIQ